MIVRRSPPNKIKPIDGLKENMESIGVIDWERIVIMQKYINRRTRKNMPILQLFFFSISINVIDKDPPH